MEKEINKLEKNDILDNYGEIFKKETVLSINKETDTIDESIFYIEDNKKSCDTNSKIILTDSGIALIILIAEKNSKKEKILNIKDPDTLIFLENLTQNFDKGDDNRPYNVKNEMLTDEYYTIEIFPYNNPSSQRIIEEHLNKKLENYKYINSRRML